MLVSIDGHDKIPDSVSGITTQITPIDGFELTLCNDGSHDPVPGGVKVENNQWDDPPYGTSGWKIESGGYKYMMTSAHLFNCDRSEDINGRYLYQDTQNAGTVLDHSHKYDWSIASVDAIWDEDHDVGGYSNTIEGYSGEKGGHVTDSGIDDMASSGESAYKSAISTCKSEGEVVGHDYELLDFTVECDGTQYKYDYDNQIMVDIPNESGDSGSMIFREGTTFDGCNYIAAIGLNNLKSEDEYGNTYAYGTQAYYLANSEGFNFQPDSIC